MKDLAKGVKFAIHDLAAERGEHLFESLLLTQRILVLRDGNIILDTTELSQAIQALQTASDEDDDDRADHNDRIASARPSE